MMSPCWGRTAGGAEAARKEICRIGPAGILALQEPGVHHDSTEQGSTMQSE